MQIEKHIFDSVALSVFLLTPFVAFGQQPSTDFIANVQQPSAEFVTSSRPPSTDFIASVQAPSAEFAAAVQQPSAEFIASAQQSSADSIAPIQQLGLKTQPGIEFGGVITTYKYEEPSLGVKLKGSKFGLDLSGILSQGDDWFIRGDFRYENGKTDYTGSGTKNGNSDWYFELRGTIGKDYDQGTYSFSPYAGIGYRNLYNDVRGVTSTGAMGYRRESQYIFLPVGVTHRLKLGATSRLATTLEYDHLIDGSQKSYLNDVSPLVGVQANTQHSGYGIRGSLYYETNNWSFGPWFQYWNINQSDTTFPIAGLFGFEPQNKTTEFGLRLGYRF